MNGSVAAKLVGLAFWLTATATWSAPDVSLSKTVMPAVPSAGEPVEFQIVVRNVGDTEAVDVQVNEKLPAGLELSPGMAPFVSQGTYDEIAGVWTLGSLAPAAEATMSLPAQRDGSPVAPCVVNTASVQPVSGDTVAGNNRAAVAVRDQGVERCVDLVFENILFSVPAPICTNESSASLTLFVRNNGPDEARGVSVEMGHSPQNLPGFGFSDSDCSGTQANRCDLGVLPAGSVRALDIVSGSFSNNSAYTLNLQLTLSTTDTDHVAADNAVLTTRQVPILADSDCGLPEGFGIGGASCFIATAAWGSAWHDNVVTLRQFRDRHLLSNAPGRAFVDWYYRYSPALANYIATRPAWRAAVRSALTPVVFSIRHPVVSLVLIILVIAAGLFRFQSR